MQITDKTVISGLEWRGKLTRNRNGRKRMKALVATVALSVLPVVAFAQDAPKFFNDVSPAPSAAAAWQEYMAVMNPKGALDDKTKQLIALGVAAQIPCEYCIYAHNKAARAAGATDAEIKEAISAAALVRKWSTELNGNMYDMTDFRKQVDAMYAGAKTQ
jgi:AhpD family alkylhydroperoxidase